MINIHRDLTERKLRTRMLLQVHDELVFDVYMPEEPEVRPLIEERMKTAIPMKATHRGGNGFGANLAGGALRRPQISYSLHHAESHHVRAIIRAHNVKRCRE